MEIHAYPSKEMVCESTITIIITTVVITIITTIKIIII